MFQAMFEWAPTPTVTLLASLGLVLVGSITFLVGRKLLAKKDDTAGTLDRLLNGLRSLDKGLVYFGSRAVGTAIPNPLARRIAVPVVLTAIATASIFVPAPFGLLLVVLGLLAILIVFRHWSRDEDLVRELEAINKLPEPEDREVPIRGELTTEVVVACAFVLVFACVAFAQIADAGLGFQLKADAGPFAFIFYALIELVKAGVLVDYYDLLADQLPFDRASDVRHSGPWAKAAVLTYRLSVNLLLLAVLIRLVEIARRKAEGRDLRVVRAMLESQDAKAQRSAIAELSKYARLGRANAAVELERVIDPFGELRFPAEVKLEAAEALHDYAGISGSSSALYAVVNALRAMSQQDFSRSEQWNDARNELATGLRDLGARERNPDLLKEAAKMFRAKNEELSPNGPTARLGEAQNNLGNALADLAELSGHPETYRDAENAYRSATETLAKVPEAGARYAIACRNLGGVLVERGKIKGDDPLFFEDAIKVYNIAIERFADDDNHRASAQTGLGDALCELSEHEPGNSEHLRRALDAFRQALTVRTPARAPLQWATTQIGRARALQMLGDREKSLEKLYEARLTLQRVIDVLRGRNIPDGEAEARKHLETIAASIKRFSSDV